MNHSHDPKTRSSISISKVEGRWENPSSKTERWIFLEQLAGTGAGRHLHLEVGKSYRMGRDPQCDVVLLDDTCSRAHAIIHTTLTEQGHPKVELEDVGSANGSLIDGKNLTPQAPHAWRPGEVLELGPSSRFLIAFATSEEAKLLAWITENPEKDLSTGYLNHRGFLQAFEIECSRLAKNPDQQIALMVCKAYASAGRASAKVAKDTFQWLIPALRKVSRVGTIPGRIDPYHLGFLIRDCDIEGAHAAVTRFLEASRQSERTGVISIAFGVLLIPGKYRLNAQGLIDTALAQLFVQGMNAKAPAVVEYTPAPTEL
ncbi:MAG: hypothetical protein RJB38_1645 [Pseudomonadota bacterium]|jgi:hypothetical protein